MLFFKKLVSNIKAFFSFYYRKIFSPHLEIPEIPINYTELAADFIDKNPDVVNISIDHPARQAWNMTAWKIGYYFSEIQEFDKAVHYYSKVSLDFTYGADAYFKAGNILLYQLDKPQEALNYFHAAALRGDKDSAVLEKMINCRINGEILTIEEACGLNHSQQPNPATITSQEVYLTSATRKLIPKKQDVLPHCMASDNEFIPSTYQNMVFEKKPNQKKFDELFKDGTKLYINAKNEMVNENYKDAYKLFYKAKDCFKDTLKYCKDDKIEKRLNKIKEKKSKCKQVLTEKHNRLKYR